MEDRGAGGLVCRILGSGEVQIGFLGYSLSVIVFNLAILVLDIIFAEFYCQVLLDALLNSPF